MDQKNSNSELAMASKEFAETKLTLAMLQSIVETDATIDNFSIWLMGGAGLTGSLLISQVGTILPHLTEVGFKISLIFLVLSVIFGLAAKFYMLQCRIFTNLAVKATERVVSIMDGHIENMTSKDDSRIDVKKVMQNIEKSFPKWAHKAVTKPNLQPYQIAINAYSYQILFTFLQSISFLCFLLTAVIAVGITT